MIAPPERVTSPRSSAVPGISVPVADVEIGQADAAAPFFDDADAIVLEPREVGGRAVDVGSYVPGFAAFGRYDPCITAGRALVGHDAADEGDLGAVGGEARDGDLEAVERAGDGSGVEDDLVAPANDGNARRRHIEASLAVGSLSKKIKFCHPPVVFAGRIRSNSNDLILRSRCAWIESKFVDVKVIGGVEGARTFDEINAVDALDLDAVFADDAGPGLHGGEGARRAGGVFDEEEADGFAVGRPGERVDVAGKVGELAGFAGRFRPKEDLILPSLL